MIVAAAPQLTVAILYDTSYLMSGGGPVIIHTPICGLDTRKNRNWIFRTVGVTHIVAEEVKREIYGHFDDADKLRATRSARKVIAELIGRSGTTDGNCRYQEVALTAVARAYSAGDVLGADSRTDRLLVGYAKQLAEAAASDCVYLATDDGGIMIDVNKLRLHQRLNLHCIPSKDGPNITELVASTAPEAKREYYYYAIDLPGLLWKKLFG
jgi:hypothetical protein